MKLTLVVVALGTAFATQAFAQEPATIREQSTARAHAYLPDFARNYYAYERNGNVNRDFQLGGSRWKTNKAKRHHSSANQK
jgi:hypothetical protein